MHYEGALTVNLYILCKGHAKFCIQCIFICLFLTISFKETESEAQGCSGVG